MKKWEDWIVGVIGAWYAISAFVPTLGKATTYNFYNYLLLGIVLVALSLWDLSQNE